MYENLIKVLEERGISPYIAAKFVGTKYCDFIDKLNGENDFTDVEIRRLFDLISDKGSDDFFDYLFSGKRIHH